MLKIMQAFAKNNCFAGFVEGNKQERKEKVQHIRGKLIGKPFQVNHGKEVGRPPLVIE